jgi:hypothetical protein
MKSVIDASHVPLTNYKLLVGGVDITITNMSEIEEVLETIVLPDRSIDSAGRTTPVEFTITVPMHHTVDIVFMETWYAEGQDPILPTYKKPAALTYETIEGSISTLWIFYDLFVTKRTLPGGSMNSSGEMAEITYTMSASDIISAPEAVIGLANAGIAAI